MSRPGRTGTDEADRRAEDRVVLVVDAEAVVLARPSSHSSSCTTTSMRLRSRIGGDAEEVLDVEDAEAAHLDVVAEQVGGRAEDHARAVATRTSTTSSATSR